MGIPVKQRSGWTSLWTTQPEGSASTLVRLAGKSCAVKKKTLKVCWKMGFPEREGRGSGLTSFVPNWEILAEKSERLLLPDNSISTEVILESFHRLTLA